MHPFKSNRLAWSVAIASLALWATSAPISWGAVVAGTAHLLDQSADDSASTATATTDTTTTIDIQQGDTTTVTNAGGAQSAQCPTLPPAIAQLIPPTPTAAPAPASASAAAQTAPGAQDGSFHICGADPQTAAAIEGLIAGRGFSATLSAHGDGCADLTIHVTAGTFNGSSSSNLSVSLGGGRNLGIQIASQQGVTHVSIVER